MLAACIAARGATCGLGGSPPSRRCAGRPPRPRAAHPPTHPLIAPCRCLQFGLLWALENEESVAKLVVLNTPLSPKTGLRPELAAYKNPVRACGRGGPGSSWGGIIHSLLPPRGPEAPPPPACTADTRPPSLTIDPAAARRCPSCAPRRARALLATCSTRREGRTR